MSDPSDPSVPHLDELLAGYVDGSATPEERLAVEAHASTCQRCREEVGLATSARAALAALPEVEPPGIAREGVAGLTRGRLRPVPSKARPAPERAAVPRGRRRLAWVPALAAAAAVIAVAGLVVPSILRSSGGPKSPTAAAPNPARGAAESSPLPVLVQKGADYGVKSLNSLAANLRPIGRSALRSAPTSSPLYGQAEPGALASDAAQREASRAALTCLRSGGGLEDAASPVYLEEATVQGTPAYIGAFVRPNSKLNFVLVAVSRAGCQPLYSVTQPI